MFKWTAASGNFALCKAIITYEASVRGGDVIPTLWQHIIPDSMGESYFLFVCQKHDPMNYAIPDTPAMELWKIAQPLIKNNQ